ncbi:MAG: dihydroorotase [Bacilli bacterium]|jgi:dihydroorotase|nr:dihydroorotase [Bacilli bacterium]
MPLNKYQLVNGSVYLNGSIVSKNITIDNGIIVNISDELDNNYNQIDCTNKLITPGFIDVHTHFRTPGYSYKEDIKTGSEAAIKGGFLDVCTMPNTNPVLDNYNVLKEYIEKTNRYSCITIHLFSAATINQKGEELVDIKKISKLNIIGFSDDGRGIQDDNIMKELLIEAGKQNKLVSAHCEDESEFIDGMGYVDESHDLDDIKISQASEYKMIARDLEIIEKIHEVYPYQYHVCHISTKKSLEIIQDGKAKGFNISCEVTPHHLISDSSEIDLNDANYKMNPPLRSSEDVDYLVSGLNDGSIDIIATDHAPHTEEEKSQPFKDAPFGIIGLELAFSLLNTYLVKTNKVSLETILRCLIDNPARIFKIKRKIAVNEIAFLNIIDLDQDVIYDRGNIKSKSKNTFYLNRLLQGKVVMNIFNNNRYYW